MLRRRGRVRNVVVISYVPIGKYRQQSHALLFQRVTAGNIGLLVASTPSAAPVAARNWACRFGVMTTLADADPPGNAQQVRPNPPKQRSRGRYRTTVAIARKSLIRRSFYLVSTVMPSHTLAHG
jgi:hypothetical protein